VRAWGSRGLLADASQGRADPGDAETMAAERLRDLQADWAEQYAGVDIETDIVLDHQAARCPRPPRADLAVLGRHHVRGSGAPALESALHAVLDHAPGPIAIIPDR
jgi:hypothetical protein